MKKTRKDYSTPVKKDLITGNVLPIYLDFTQEEGFLGNAKLIKHKPSTWRNENLGFIRTIIGGSGNEKEGYGVMWKHQRWVVEFVDGPLIGHTTAANIGYFYDYSFLDKNMDEEE